MMNPVDDVKAVLAHSHQRLKWEQQTKPCSHCGKRGPKCRLCVPCGFVRYCSTNCQRAAWPLHKAACGLLAPLTKIPGYISDLPVSDYAKGLLVTHGQQYFKNGLQGCIAVTFHLAKHQQRVRKLLANTETSAKWTLDPNGQILYHYFVMPAKSLLYGNFNPAFTNFVFNPHTHRYFVPVLKMSVEGSSREPTPDDPSTYGYEVTSVGYLALPRPWRFLLIL